MNPTPATPPALINRVELAKQLSVSPRQVDYLRAQGRIPAIEIGRRCVRYKLADCIATLSQEAADVRNVER